MAIDLIRLCLNNEIQKLKLIESMTTIHAVHEG